MKFYLASSYTKKASMRAAKNVIEALGHEVAARWLDGQETVPTTDNKADCIESALKDIQDIDQCDTVIVFTDKPSTTGGFHVEFGIALASRKKIVVVGPIRNIFMAMPHIMHFDDWNGFVASLGNGDGIRNHLRSVPTK